MNACIYLELDNWTDEFVQLSREGRAGMSEHTFDLDQGSRLGTAGCDFKSNNQNNGSLTLWRKPNRASSTSFLWGLCVSWLIIFFWALFLTATSSSTRAISVMVKVGRIRCKQRKGFLHWTVAFWRSFVTNRFRNRSCHRAKTGDSLNTSTGYKKSIPVSRERQVHRTSKSLFLLMLLLSPNVPVGQPDDMLDGLNQEQERETIGPAGLLRFYVHSYTRDAVKLPAPLEAQTQVRSFVAQNLHMRPGSRLAENFLLYRVQPHPGSCDQLYCYHFILERPDDRRFDQSIVLLEGFGSGGNNRVTKHVWTITSMLLYTEFLKEAGADRECQDDRVDCIVRVNRKLWPRNDNNYMTIQNGAWIQIEFRYSLCEESESESQAIDDSSPSIIYDDDLTLMQTDYVTRGLIRRAEDPLYRLLADRLRMNQRPGTSGAAISVWNLQPLEISSSIETRIWLDENHESWADKAYRECQLRRHQHATRAPLTNEYFMATPSPTNLRLAANNINILTVEDRRQTETVILIDFILHTSPLRRIVRYYEGDSVDVVTNRCFPYSGSGRNVLV